MGFTLQHTVTWGLFKIKAKDGLPDPNGPLSSHVPSDESIGQPRSIRRGAQGVSAGSVASEGKKRGPYNR